MIIELKTQKLNSGFGGWIVTKDGATISIKNQNPDDWENVTELKDIEVLAKKEPEHKWLAIVFLPLRGATYERSKCGNWNLIETNNGFA